MRKDRKNSIREAIVETASRLFYKQGYGNTGINQIIEESGVVKSSLYTIFRSKEDILMAYLETSGAATILMTSSSRKSITDAIFSTLFLKWAVRTSASVSRSPANKVLFNNLTKMAGQVPNLFAVFCAFRKCTGQLPYPQYGQNLPSRKRTRSGEPRRQSGKPLPILFKRPYRVG